MLYLVNLLKFKWIYYALSVLVSALAALQSVRFLFCLLLLMAFCAYHRFSKKQLVGLILLGLVSFSYFHYEVKKLNEPLLLPATLTWTGEYKVNGASLRGFMTTEEGERVYVSYQLKSEQEKHLFTGQSVAGKSYFVTGELIPPSPPAHRYGFSMAQYLKSKQARGIVEIGSLTFAGEAKSWLQPLYEQRFILKRYIGSHFPQTLVAEAQALLIGLQENVDDELNRAYQKLGITHLFAISGLHVALVSWLFYETLLRLRVRRELATIILLIILPVYAIIAGGAPSVWRAVSVVELVMLASYLKWKIPIADALAMSFIGFVLLEPGAVLQIGFQLSYFATLALVYSGRILTRYQNWWVQSFFITFVCQLLVYPLLLFHFFEISLSSFLANILFVPLFSFVILPANVLLLLASFVPGPIAALLFTVYEPCRLLLTELILWLQTSSYQMWNPGKPTLFWLVLLYVSVFAAFYLLDKAESYKKVAAVLLIPALLFHMQPYLHKELKIAFVNVGQGDCIVIELPFRRGIYVIDAGGLLRFEQEAWKERDSPYEVGRQVVVPYLKGRGIQAVDTFMLTHADADHAEGAEEVLKEVRVREVHVTPNSLDKPVMNDFLVEVKKTRTPVYEQMMGRSWEHSGIAFHYLWPIETVYEGNNDSLVLLVTYKDFKALFTGDLEKEGEAALVQRYRKQIAGIDLLKAGHHGSKTSSSEPFVSLTNPKFTVFMAGENNRYNHPHAEVVERFDARSLPYATTGYEGTIEISVRNGQMSATMSNELFAK
ncbi:MAG: DNA internalization-related competence protein ComEC/Rec2 [Solibacillus sp.]